MILRKFDGQNYRDKKYMPLLTPPQKAINSAIHGGVTYHIILVPIYDTWDTYEHYIYKIVSITKKIYYFTVIRKKINNAFKSSYIIKKCIF